MKTRTKKLLPVLAVAVLAFAMLFPLHALADPLSGNLPCEAWEGDFAAINPLGEAPRAKVRLTPTGTEFTEWELPTEFEVVFKDGRSRTVSAENPVETDNNEGFSPRVGFTFDAEIDGEAFSFFTVLTFYESGPHCRFAVGHTGTGIDAEGQTKDVVHYVYETECDTEVDRGNVFNYIAHRIHYLFWNLFWDIKSFFMNL